MSEICETVAETRLITHVSVSGFVTFTHVSVAAVTAEPYHFFTCFRQVSVEGDNCFRKRNFVLHLRKHKVTLRKHEFFMFPWSYSDLKADGNTRLRSGTTFFIASIVVIMYWTETFDC